MPTEFTLVEFDALLHSRTMARLAEDCVLNKSYAYADRLSYAKTAVASSIRSLFIEYIVEEQDADVRRNFSDIVSRISELVQVAGGPGDIRILSSSTIVTRRVSESFFSTMAEGVRARPILKNPVSTQLGSEVRGFQTALARELNRPFGIIGMTGRRRTLPPLTIPQTQRFQSARENPTAVPRVERRPLVEMEYRPSPTSMEVELEWRDVEERIFSALGVSRDVLGEAEELLEKTEKHKDEKEDSSRAVDFQRYIPDFD